jgi:hypothetical protein
VREPRDLAHLVQVEAELLQDQDAVQLRELRHRVGAIAAPQIGVSRREKADLVVEAQQPR